jgi:hypothetical protein
LWTDTKHLDFFFTDEFPAYGNWYSGDIRFGSLGFTGRRSFNQWDAYVKAVKNMGRDQAVETVQGWYDNYWKAVGN